MLKKKLYLVLSLALLLVLAALPALAQEGQTAGEAEIPADVGAYDLPGGCPACGHSQEAEFPAEETGEEFDWDAWIDAEILRAAEDEPWEAPADTEEDADWDAWIDAEILRAAEDAPWEAPAEEDAEGLEDPAFCPECGQLLDGGALEETDSLGMEGFEDAACPGPVCGDWYPEPGMDAWEDDATGFEDGHGFDPEDGAAWDDDSFMDEDGYEYDFGDEAAWAEDPMAFGEDFDAGYEGTVLSGEGQALLIEAYTLLDELRGALEKVSLPEAEGLRQLAGDINAVISRIETGATYE